MLLVMLKLNQNNKDARCNSKRIGLLALRRPHKPGIDSFAWWTLWLFIAYSNYT